MHELSIASSLLDAAVVHAQAHRASAVLAIHCRIGVVRQVDIRSLHEAFALARHGTLAANAELKVTIVGMILNCRVCGTSTELPTWAFDCPNCGSGEVRLLGGDDLELTSLELEVTDDDRSAAQEYLPHERSRRADESCLVE